MLFGSKKRPEKTYLLLDIETGSVGGALVRTAASGSPRLFGEVRFELAAGTSRTGEALRTKVADATARVARSLAEVSARLRGHKDTVHIGHLHQAAAFLAAPWGTPNLAAGTPHFNQPLVGDITNIVSATFAIPTATHAQASATLAGARTLLPYEHTYLVCMPGGEVTEVLEVSDGAVQSYGTLPVGRHNILRTLASHGGLGEQEGRSALRALALGASPAHVAEPLRHAHEHIAGHFTDLAGRHDWHKHTRVFVVGHDADWFARALAQSSAAARFPAGATIQHLRGAHASPHFAGHAQAPDLGLMLAGFFVDSHYR